MRKIVLIMFMYSFLSTNAQVAIGKNTVDGSGVLDFATNLSGGMVLPRVTEIPTQAAAITNGTMLVNAVDLSQIKVQFRENNLWKDLTDAIDLPYLDINLAPDNGQKIIIGSNTSTADGLLVLESNSKALILPKVADVSQLKNAVVGTLFYDLSTKSMAVFDGKDWILWK